MNSETRGWWWAAGAVLVLLLVLFALPMVRILMFMSPLLVLGAAVVGVALLVRRAVNGQFLPARFGSEEEARRSERLRELERRRGQMEATLRDLEVLRLDRPEAIRAEWAGAELEETLVRVRSEIAHEKGLLLLLQVGSWMGMLEPLLRRKRRLGAAEIRTWVGRLPHIADEGKGLRAAFHRASGVEAPAGQTAQRLLEEALTEIERLRGDLLTEEARLLARTPVPKPVRPLDLPAIERLSELLSEARARREVRGWELE
jgi:hypothetical protein